MVGHEQALVGYIEMVTGAKPRLEALPAAAALPLFLRQHFDLAGLELFGRKIVLALEKKRPGELSAGEYAQNLDLLKRRLGEDVVLVMAKVASYVRSRLVQRGIPFIVPGAQMFMPMMMVDLRERSSRPASRTSDKLSPVSQIAVIYQILREPDAHIPLAQLGERLGYSPQSMSSVQEELLQSGLCEVRRMGKMAFLEFSHQGRALWEKAEPLMTTPVRKTRWVRWGRPRAHAVEAGTSALSRMSMLAEDPLATYAMRNRDLAAALGKGQLFECDAREDADAGMESWKYDPWVLAENGVADPCSLYLSLRESGDERVQKEISSLIERMPQ